jgi:hypothetical protein
MITSTDYLKKLKNLRNGLTDEVERIIYDNESEIIKLNVQKIEVGQGSDDRQLKNDDSRYTGRYTLGTNLLRPEKKAGDLYTFFETGSFLGNFKVEVLPNKTQIEIFSTGTGGGLKADFFRGYKNIFGLTTQDQRKLNYEIIYPDLMRFVNRYI